MPRQQAFGRHQVPLGSRDQTGPGSIGNPLGSRGIYRLLGIDRLTFEIWDDLL